MNDRSRHRAGRTRVDWPTACSYACHPVKRALSLLLLIGAMIGLLGQTAVYAASTRPPVASTAIASVDSDCMSAMHDRQPQPARKPCNGFTPDCIAAMGCLLPAIVGDRAKPALASDLRLDEAFWPAAASMVGNEVAPEPHPPSLLG